jgi:PKD repeat protein
MGSNKFYIQMKLGYIALLLIFISASFTSTFAQNNGFSCAHSEMQQKIWEENPQFKLDYEKLLASAKTIEYVNGKKRTKFIIPIVFHILHEYGEENITDAQVKNQVDILNRDFNKLNADTADVDPAFKNLIANCNFEFRLATKDPQGNCTNGINHIYTHLTNSASDASKLNQWNRSQYLNVWVTKSIGRSGVAGYAYFPNGALGANFYADGVIIINDYIGNIGTGTEYRSRALTHEIGHYFGLPHVWGSGEVEAGCGDDYVEDTPVTKGYKSCPSPSLSNPQACTNTLNYIMSLDSVSLTSGKKDITPLTKFSNITFTPLSANGVGSNSLSASSFDFSNWETGGINGDTTFSNQTGSINLSKYYEYTVTADTGSMINLNKILFKISRDKNGVKSIAVRYDVDNYSSNLSIKSSSTNSRIINNQIYFTKDTLESTLATVTLSGLSDLRYDSPVTFRIYGWNAEDSNGNFEIDSINTQGLTGTVDNIQNYMEYSYCSNMFTKGQLDLMTLSLLNSLSSRNNLYTEKNLQLTGTADLTTVTCTPKADFNVLIQNKTTAASTICKGTSIQFFDQTTIASADSRKWIFTDGASEITSTDINPIVTFTTPGYKDVTLIVSNAIGSDTLTRKKYIHVSEDLAYFYPADFKADFNDGLMGDWIVENHSNEYSIFQTSSNGYNNTGCVKLNNYKNTTEAYAYEDDYYYYPRLAGSKDAIISPSIDFSASTNPTLTFKYSFATDAYYDSLITDKINVYTSKNCGESWTLKKIIGGPAISSSSLTSKTLLTAGNFSGKDFAPTNNVLWGTISIPLQTTSADTRTRIKIEFEASSYANNLYIDDIELSGVLGISENPLYKLDLNIHPNPTVGNDGININYTANNEAVAFKLLDVQGKELYNETNYTTNGSVNHHITLENGVNSGCYYLVVTQGEYSYTRKVIIL